MKNLIRRAINGKEYADIIYTKTTIRLGWIDWIKVLFGKAIIVSTDIYVSPWGVDGGVNAVFSNADTIVEPIFQPKSKGIVQEAPQTNQPTAEQEAQAKKELEEWPTKYNEKDLESKLADFRHEGILNDDYAAAPETPALTADEIANMERIIEEAQKASQIKLLRGKRIHPKNLEHQDNILRCLVALGFVVEGVMSLKHLLVNTILIPSVDSMSVELLMFVASDFNDTCEEVYYDEIDSFFYSESKVDRFNKIHKKPKQPETHSLKTSHYLKQQEIDRLVAFKDTNVGLLATDKTIDELIKEVNERYYDFRLKAVLEEIFEKFFHKLEF
jgi:hypothetical protein